MSRADDDRPRRPAKYDDDYDDEADGARRPPRRPAPLGDDPGLRMLLPVGRSGWAIAAGYLGLVSVLCVPGPLALIAGLLAVRDMRRHPEKHGMGRAVFGIVMGALGSVGLVLSAVGMIAAAVSGK